MQNDVLLNACKQDITSLSILVGTTVGGNCSDKSIVEQYSFYTSRKTEVGDTITGKNMFQSGSIGFPLRIAPKRVEHNFKGQLIGNKCSTKPRQFVIP